MSKLQQQTWKGYKLVPYTEPEENLHYSSWIWWLRTGCRLAAPFSSLLGRASSVMPQQLEHTYSIFQIGNHHPCLPLHRCHPRFSYDSKEACQQKQPFSISSHESHPHPVPCCREAFWLHNHIIPILGQPWTRPAFSSQKTLFFIFMASCS